MWSLPGEFSGELFCDHDARPANIRRSAPEPPPGWFKLPLEVTVVIFRQHWPWLIIVEMHYQLLSEYTQGNNFFNGCCGALQNYRTSVQVACKRVFWFLLRVYATVADVANRLAVLHVSVLRHCKCQHFMNIGSFGSNELPKATTAGTTAKWAT